MTAPHRVAGTRPKVRNIGSWPTAPSTEQAPDLGHLIDSPVEAMVIGTVMTAGEPSYRQIRFLTAEDFAVEPHRIVWRAIARVADEVHPTVDEIYHQVTSAGMLDAIGLAYLLDLHGQAIPGISLKLKGSVRAFAGKRGNGGFGC